MGTETRRVHGPDCRYRMPFLADCSCCPSLLLNFRLTLMTTYDLQAASKSQYVWCEAGCWGGHAMHSCTVRSACQHCLTRRCLPVCCSKCLVASQSLVSSWTLRLPIAAGPLASRPHGGCLLVLLWLPSAACKQLWSCCIRGDKQSSAACLWEAQELLA